MARPPLSRTVVFTLCLIAAAQANPNPQGCSSCGGVPVGVVGSSSNQAFTSIKTVPGEVHSSASFEGCNSETGCGGVKIEDGKVVDQYGNPLVIKGSLSTNSILDAPIPKDGPYWWMQENSPFSNAFAAYNKNNKVSGSIDLAGNPFLNGVPTGFTASGNSASFASGSNSGSSGNGAIDITKNPFLTGQISGAPITGGSSSFQSSFQSSSTSGNKNALDLAGNPFLNGGFSSGSLSSSGNTGGIDLSNNPFLSGQSFGAAAGNTQGSFSQGNFVQQQEQVSGAFPGQYDNEEVGSGKITISCIASGHICVPKGQCVNGQVVGNVLLKAQNSAQYCQAAFESCCRIPQQSATTIGFGSQTGFGSQSGFESNFQTTKTGSSSFTNTLGDSSSAGTVLSQYRPGSEPNQKPGIPYLPPVESSSISPGLIYPTPSLAPYPPAVAIVPSPTPPIYIPVATSPRPTLPPYRPPVTAQPTYFAPRPTNAPQYLPPPNQLPEQSINSPTYVPKPEKEGSILLSPSIFPKQTPNVIPDVPSGCAAALKCTPKEFCSSEGSIVTSPVVLTKEQEAFRVPLTDCKDLETGAVGKCCRDPNYTDPWPTGLIGKWVPEAFGDTGAYKPDSRGQPNARPVKAVGVNTPDSRGSPNSIRPTSFPRPIGGEDLAFPVRATTPRTGGIILDNFRTPAPGSVGVFPSPTPDSRYEPSQPTVIASIPNGFGINRGQTTYTPSPFAPGQGAFGQGSIERGQGAFGQGSIERGQGSFGSSESGQGAFGQGSFEQGQGGFAINRGQGAFGSGSFGGLESSSEEFRYILSGYQTPSQCGIPNNQRPFGDRENLEVDFGAIPWQAMILLETNRSLLCGGVITRPDVVITSARCVDGLDAKNVLIKGGEYKLGIDEEPLPFQIVAVRKILRHPGYRTGVLINDVAILVLTEQLRLAANIYPICLPSAGEQFDSLYAGEAGCITSGWGKQILQVNVAGSILHSVNLSLVQPSQCQSQLSRDYPHLLNQYDSNSCACARPSNPVDNICKVDIGSALACQNGNGHYVLRGVYSWETTCNPGDQLASFYKFDLEWYEWALGLSQGSGSFNGNFASGNFLGGLQISGNGNFLGGSQLSGNAQGNGHTQFVRKTEYSSTQGQFNGGNQGQSGLIPGSLNLQGQIGANQGAGFSKGGFSSGQYSFSSQTKLPTVQYQFETKSPVTTYQFETKTPIKGSSYKTSYQTQQKQVFTSPTIVYETSGSGQNPQFIAPGVTVGPDFQGLVNGHIHTGPECDCLNGK